MAAQSGKDMLVKLDQTVSGSFLTVAGLRTRSLALNAAAIDITDAESAGRWRELLSGGEPMSAEHARRALAEADVEPHELDRRVRGGDRLSHLDLEPGRRAVARASRRRFGDRRDDRRGRVAEDQRSPGPDPVEVAVAIDVEELAAFAALDEDRVAADRPHRPNRGVDPSRHHLERAPVELIRPAYECSASQRA